MLAIRLRVSPCRARCSPRLVGRSTVSTPSACSTFISLESTWASSPFGPLTATWPGLSSTVTASGTVIGFLPIRLISCSPDVGDYLAADALCLGFVTGHDADRGADDRRAGAAEDARDLFVVDAAAATGARDPLQAGDHGATILRVLEADLDLLADASRLLAEIEDVALLLEDPRHLQLQPRGGNLHLVVAGAERVADPGQVIGYRVSKHVFGSLPAGLGHAGNVALVCRLAQADSAEAELAVVGTRPATAAATVVVTGFELVLADLVHLQRSLSHSPDSPRWPHSRPARRPRRRALRPPRRPPRSRAWRMPRGSPP